MGSHPINLAFRFLLEITALAVTGYWGWQQSDPWLKFLLTIGLPVLLAAVWGIFAVPDDPSRSGKAPIVTPGIIRLLIELGIFAFATWCLSEMDYKTIAIVFGLSVALHYALSYDRIIWLIKR